MTRKRFTKLCMGARISRNDVQKIITEQLPRCKSYDALYRKIVKCRAFVQSIANAVKETMQNLAECIGGAFVSLAASCAEAVKLFRDGGRAFSGGAIEGKQYLKSGEENR